MKEQKIVKDFLKKIESSYGFSNIDISRIKTACNVAILAHKGQTRKYSGGPFIEHPIKVALLSAKRFGQVDLIIASILHDTVEDNNEIKMSDIYSNFGKKIGFMVDSVTDNINYFLAEPSVALNDKIEKILYGGMIDIRCILLKLHDRENNINTLEGLETDKQIRMSFETQAIYEPLRKLLGFNRNKKKSIKDCEIILGHYLSANKIHTAKEFKEALLNQTFYDFDNDTFNLVYKNASRIFWKIQDKDVFEKLVEAEHFDDKINVISIDQDMNGNFCAVIKYKQGNVFGNLKTKMTVHKSSS